MNSFSIFKFIKCVVSYSRCPDGVLIVLILLLASQFLKVFEWTPKISQAFLDGTKECPFDDIIINHIFLLINKRIY
jgi:hypothetical protein